MRNPEYFNNVPLNEPLCFNVPNVRKVFGLYPFCEVISSHEEPSSVTNSPREWPHYVQTPLSKRPSTREWIQDPSRLMNIWSIPLTLITLSNIILGHFCILDHQYPWVRALCDNDIPPVWLPQTPSCNSSNKGSTVSGWTHNRYGPEWERLYNFCSLESISTYLFSFNLILGQLSFL